MLVKGYPEGSDITLLNVYYTKPKKDTNGKWSKDTITLIVRDNETGKKFHQIIEAPDYEYFKVNDDANVDLSYNHLFIEKEKTHSIKTPYRNLAKSIAEETDNLKFFYDNIKNGNYSANSKLHEHPAIFNSDTHIEEHYRYRFSKEYTNETFSISKSYFDIEADTIDIKGDFPELGEAPINAVTIICEKQNKTFTLLLRNSKNPLIQEFEDGLCEDVFTELKDFIRSRVHGWKYEIRYGLDKMQYEIIFYDDEIKLIQDLFNILNYYNSDFILAWNMRFDVPYIIERIKVLGYDPAEIISHPDFKDKVAKYYIDERHNDDPAERGDFATISSYSVYLDQLIHFASRRKNRNPFDNNKLDTVGAGICKVQKLDYSHITTSIAKLPWLDYKTFVFYNIMDTIVQKCIESKVNDLDYVFNKCLINNTRYQKCHRQTVYLSNRAASEWNKSGLIIGNNCNKHNPKEPYPGALVAEAVFLNDYSKKKINGKAVDIYDNCDDYDYKSLYPSEDIEFNAAPHTQIGKIEIAQMIYKNENRYNSEVFDRGGKYIEDIQCRHYLEFCHRWLKMANYKELYYDVIDYLTNIHLSSNALFNFNREGEILPIRRTNNLDVNPIYRNEDYSFNPICRYYKMPDCTDIKNIDIGKVVGRIDK